MYLLVLIKMWNLWRYPSLKHFCVAPELNLFSIFHQIFEYFIFFFCCTGIITGIQNNTWTSTWKAPKHHIPRKKWVENGGKEQNLAAQHQPTFPSPPKCELRMLTNANELVWLVRVESNCFKIISLALAPFLVPCSHHIVKSVYEQSSPKKASKLSFGDVSDSNSNSHLVKRKCQLHLNNIQFSQCFNTDPDDLKGSKLGGTTGGFPVLPILPALHECSIDLKSGVNEILRS